MIGLKSGMIRPNHATKWHDFAQKGACGNAHDTKSLFFERKKGACGNAQDKKTSFFVKAPVATHTTNNI